MSGANIGQHVLKPGSQISIVAIGSNEPRPMFAAAWPDCSFVAGSPGLADLALLKVSILVDENETRDNSGNVLSGNQMSMPAAGIRRAIAAQQMSIIVSLASAATMNIAVRAHAGFGNDQHEEMNGSDGIAREGGTLFVVPRFCTKWRAWDWGGDNALLSFVDFQESGAGLPQNVVAAQFPDWTPLPPGAAGIVAQTNGSCIIQFGRF